MRLNIITILLILVGSNVFAAQPAYICEPEKWVAEPVIADGHFDATLTANCLVTGAFGGGISALTDSFIQTAQSATHVDAGPTSETFEGLPSVAYEITDAQEALTIISSNHIASDRQSRAVMTNISKEVRASGSAGLTKKLDITVDVVKLAEAGQYRVALTTRVQVKKPAMIPARGFMGAAKNIAKSQFQKRRDQNLPKIVKVL